MFVNPYQDCFDKKPLKCTFHTHAGTGPGTCGAYEIDDVLAVYKELGFDCMCLSNHNLYTDPAEYEKKHGILLFPGYEYTKWEHMVCLGTDKVLVPHPETYAPLEDPVTPYQAAIDGCNADGGFPIVCHPNWPVEWAISREFLDSVRRFRAIEAHNGSCGSNAWDHVLSGGRLIWGVGSDDFHRWWNLARSWNVVYADRDKPSIMAALKAGAFYASTGLVLQGLTLDSDKISVEVINPNDYRDEFNFKFFGADGRLLKEVNEETATYRLKGGEKYVRVEVMNNAGRKLYTQPVYDDEYLSIEE